VTGFLGLPLPADAPPPGACWQLTKPEPGLLLLSFVPPHRPKLGVLDVPALRDLGLALEQVEKETAAKAMVITGREPLSFAGGADLDLIASVGDPEVAATIARLGQERYTRLARLGRSSGGRLFTVAAVGGPVPGGACELALCCDRIVLADHEKTRIGLPEVRLGILPAWGGTTRLPRRIGVPAAADSILNGKLHRARAALRLGLADRLAQPEDLLRVARDVAQGRLACPRPGRGWRGALIDRNPLAGWVIERQARQGVMRQTHGKYPAPLAVLPLIVRAPRAAVEQGLAAEVEAVKGLATSPVTKSLIAIFQGSEEAKKAGELKDGARAPRVERAGVVGAGVMGGAIASLLAENGVTARLADLDQAVLDRAALAHRRDVEKNLRRRRLRKHEAMRAVDLLATTRAPVGFARAEILIEAVAEVLSVKQRVLGAYAAQMAPDAILATNTSSLSVDALAAGLPHPERVVGMHFFNPVKRMPLVEVVRGKATSDAVVARTARLALDLGKTPVVCKDVAGFLVNRVLGPYLDEAVRLAEAGADLEAVDRALSDFGLPMGPYELLDEVGLDVAQHAAASLSEAYGERMQPSPHLKPLVEAGHLGKKTGRGIYLWEAEKGGRPRRKGRNPARPRPAGSVDLKPDALVDRLVLPMLNEAARALAEEVVAGPRVLDLATVFGMGFPPFRGGLLRYADTRGLPAIVEALERIALDPAVARRPGGRARFTPAPLLQELARSGRRFHDPR
jgi:3-hydroxyacyl-CoA dehydrogenase/enoyl-CoA hydratase/3-hydroxybutyryl-CoA epimerase